MSSARILAGPSPRTPLHADRGRASRSFIEPDPRGVHCLPRFRPRSPRLPSWKRAETRSPTGSRETSAAAKFVWDRCSPGNDARLGTMLACTQCRPRIESRSLRRKRSPFARIANQNDAGPAGAKPGGLAHNKRLNPHAGDLTSSSTQKKRPTNLWVLKRKPGNHLLSPLKRLSSAATAYRPCSGWERECPATYHHRAVRLGNSSPLFEALEGASRLGASP